MLYVSRFDEIAPFSFSYFLILFLILYATCFLNMINERHIFLTRSMFLIFLQSMYCLFFNFVFLSVNMTSFICHLILNTLSHCS